MKSNRGSAWKNVVRVSRSLSLIALLAMLGTGSDTLWAGINVWTSIGPDGGSVRALAIDPQNSATVYAATGVGVFKSTDGGASWSALNPGLPAFDCSTSLAIDPQNPSTVYAVADLGVFKSTDGGASWSAVKLPPDAGPKPGGWCDGVHALAIDPQNPGTVYAATGYGVFKSKDGGASWTAASSGMPTNPFGSYGFVNALAVDPQNPSTVYAGYAWVSGSGLFKTTDGGASWNAANSGLPTSADGHTYVSTLAVDPQSPNTLYAGTGGGVFKSTDGGASWIAATSGLPFYVSALAIDPQNPSTVFAAATIMEMVGGPAESFGELFRSTDGAASWHQVILSPSGRDLRASVINTLAIDPQNPSTVYVGTAGGGFCCDGLFKTADGGASWNAVTSGIRAANVNTLAVDPQIPGTLYAGIRGDRLFKSTSGGASWSAANSGLPDGGVGPVVINPQDPSTLYAATGGGVFKSTDAGASWKAANSGLTTDLYGYINVSTLAIDPQNQSTVYAGANGNIFKTTDGGASWTAANSGLPNNIIESLVIAPENPSTLYVMTPVGVFKTTDRGASWSPVSSGLPNGLCCFGSLVIDPENPSTVYAGIGMQFDTPRRIQEHEWGSELGCGKLRVANVPTG